MRYTRFSCLVACLFLACASVQAQEGVRVGEASAWRKLVPAEQLERQAAAQYRQLMQQAAGKQLLAPASHPELVRLRTIAERIVPHATRFNAHADRWRWEINLIDSKQINAFCMPGGKIAFYTGLTRGLELSEDEVAIVMGHEVAHALREHARERVAKSQLTDIGATILGQVIGGGKYFDLFHFGGNLVTLKFSRDDESEADLVGLELAARAGFDPRAGVSLWQKMGAVSKEQQMAWFSTHPQGDDRIAEIQRHLPEVMPLYERARRR